METKGGSATTGDEKEMITFLCLQVGIQPVLCKVCCWWCNGVESFHSTLNVVFSVVIDDLSPFTATVCHLSVAISSIKIHRIVSFLVTSSETNYKSPFGMCWIHIITVQLTNLQK